MPDDQLREARFDHVNERGDLVFEAMNRHFTVRVTDALERGILEARQIRAELEGTPQPQAAAALPISQIQSQIRSGVSVEQVAGQFNVSEALVRRFATPVETEKKYAIDQFLSMGAGRSARGQQSNADLIAEALQTSRISMDALEWKATRRGHEPWRIEAAFESSNRTLRADWSWNMRDNTVVSLNGLAKRLLGETVAPVPGLMDERAGAGAGTAMDGRPVAFWADASAAPTPGSAGAATATGTGTGTGLAAADAQTAGTPAVAAPTLGVGVATAPSMPGAVVPASSAVPAGEAGTAGEAGPEPAIATDGTAHGGVASDDDAANATPHAGAATGNPMTAWLYGGSRKTDSAGATASPATGTGTADRAPSGAAQTADARGSAPEESSTPQQPKRKSARSAVPSWDEILFGE